MPRHDKIILTVGIRGTELKTNKFVQLYVYDDVVFLGIVLIDGRRESVVEEFYCEKLDFKLDC